jgi:hypothetical protein
MTKKFLERGIGGDFDQFHFGNGGVWVVYPSPLLANGIIGLEENLEVIYGAQRVAGKILETKELRVLPLHLFLLLAPWR